MSYLAQGQATSNNDHTVKKSKGITYSKSVSGLSPERGWNTKDLFFIPRTHAESGVLAKMRPAHTGVKDICGQTDRQAKNVNFTFSVRFMKINKKCLFN